MIIIIIIVINTFWQFLDSILDIPHGPIHVSREYIFFMLRYTKLKAIEGRKKALALVPPLKRIFSYSLTELAEYRLQSETNGMFTN